MVRRLHRVEVRRGRDDLEDDDDDRSCDGESNRMTQRWRFCASVSLISCLRHLRHRKWSYSHSYTTMEKFGSGLRWQAPALTAAAAPRCAVRSLH